MRVAYTNGGYVNHGDARVHIEDRGYQFSDGIYEYIAFYNRILLDGDLHFARMERSLRELCIALPVFPGAFPIIVRELIERNGRDDGGLYIQVTRGVARRDHAFPAHIKPALVMTICGAKLPKESEVQHGVKVITSADMRWARRDIKSISLLANILAKQEAVAQGARETWLIDGQNISEGAASNSYIVSKNGELITHPVDEHILGGITRDVLLKLALRTGISVSERAFSLSEAQHATEAFLTSTSLNILPVVQIDDAKIGNGKPGAITRKLQELYAAHVFKQTGKKL